jgi:MFS family permease
MPIRQAYLNGLIPSQQRATILSFDSMLGSSGGVVVQPVLGRSADVWGYPGSYLLGAAISALAVPFVWLSRRQNAPADTAVGTPTPATVEAGVPEDAPAAAPVRN